MTNNLKPGKQLPWNELPKNFNPKKAIVVFSHLRWEFVTQRPQHIISRLAKERQVLFVEEPIGFSPTEEGGFHSYQAAGNITVIQPKIDNRNLIDGLIPILKAQLSVHRIQAPILWFYSAAFHAASEQLSHSLIVYDCMDELSAFKGASPELIRQERVLLEKADLVFTGGKSLYEAKQAFTDNIYCYPSSVDKEHFAKAMDKETPIPEDIRNIPHPITGYYGVIDERIDLDLLDKISKQNKDTSFVMIGPVVKIDPAELPENPNIYYLGGKKYDELPGYLKALDIAMMPFAMNESTRYISPTKTLEYIAALKPIISTPVYDVVRDYSNCIAIVENAAQFTSSLRCLQAPTEKDIGERKQNYQKILSAVSWDQTVAAMKNNIEDLLAKKDPKGQGKYKAASAATN